MKEQPSILHLIIISFIVATFSFKIFSLFFLPIMVVQIKNNWKRSTFILMTLGFIVLVNSWYCIICYSHITNEYYVQDFLTHNPFSDNSSSLLSALKNHQYQWALEVFKFTFMMRPSASYPAFAMILLFIDWIKKMEQKKIVFTKFCFIINWLIILIVFCYMLCNIFEIAVGFSILGTIWGIYRLKIYRRNKRTVENHFAKKL